MWRCKLLREKMKREAGGLEEEVEEEEKMKERRENGEVGTVGN